MVVSIIMDRIDSQDNRRSKIWAIIRGRYGVEPDLSFSLWDLPFFLIAIGVVSGALGIVGLSGMSQNYDFLELFTMIAPRIGLSVATNLFFYFLTITLPLLFRFRFSRKRASIAGAVILTAFFLYLHIIEMIFFYEVILGLPIPIASDWITTCAAIGSYKILRYPDFAN